MKSGWKPELDAESQQKLLNLQQQHYHRLRHAIPQQRRLQYMQQPSSQQEISDPEIRQALQRFHQPASTSAATDTYAVVEINSRLYSVRNHDILVLKHLKGTRPGDWVQFTRVRELGRVSATSSQGDTALTPMKLTMVRNETPDTTYDTASSNASNPITPKVKIPEQPHIQKQTKLLPKGYTDIQAVVVGHTRSAKYQTLRKRVGKGGGDRKFRVRSYRNLLTVVRFVKVGVPEEVL